MKNALLIRLMAAVTTLMYVAAIVGFDIHTDREHGHIYIHSLLSDLSCESTHPDSPCTHHHHDCDCCCDCDDHGCDEDEDCCSDESEQLRATADMVSMTFLSAACIPAFTSAPVAVVPAFYQKSLIKNDLCKGPPRTILSKDCILLV